MSFLPRLGNHLPEEIDAEVQRDRLAHPDPTGLTKRLVAASQKAADALGEGGSGAVEARHALVHVAGLAARILLDDDPAHPRQRRW